MNSLNTDLVNIAIEKSDGEHFERFALEFLQSTNEYLNFIPNGGKKDGGADGYIHSDNEITVFFQVSIEKNIENKIQKTLDRLRDFGRNPKRLFYITNLSISNKDKKEEDFYDKFGIQIRLLDKNYITNNINKNNATIKSFNTHLSRFIDFLPRKDSEQIISISNSHIEHPEVYVFLMQELDSRNSETELLHGLMDSLIFWALRDTDPDKEIVMSESTIRDNIFNSFPWAKKIILNLFKHRIESLSKKKQGRKIKFHSKLKGYVLPYDTRQQISIENSRDENIQSEVLRQILEMKELSSLSTEEKDTVSICIIDVLRLFFEKEGLRFSCFLNDSNFLNIDFSENVIDDRILDVVRELQLTTKQEHQYRDIIKNVMRNLFYNSTQEQRLYLSKLSRTYVFLFSLQADPKIVEYFQKATANFKLFVGTDLIVKAISEKYLTEENQLVRNLFKMCADAGIELILTETSLEGVRNHFIVTDNEFRNNIIKIENIPELISYSDKILIRTYYYAKLKNNYERSWREFVSEFISYHCIHESNGKEELKDYITQQFGMSYLSLDEMNKNIDSNKVDELSENILTIKDNSDLSKGIATTILSVYNQRKQNKEHSTFPVYGYQTWWLTNEARILSVTKNIVNTEGSSFIMRPEFLLNFFSMSASVADVRETYKNIFPSIIGIQMGNRLPNNIFESILSKVEEWQNLESGRCIALTKKLIDKLKSEYSSNVISSDSLDIAIRELERDLL